MRIERIIVADFETTIDEATTRVWLAGYKELISEKLHYFSSIELFLEEITEKKYKICYFHNLKFDGSFIIDWLFKNDFKNIDEKLIIDKKHRLQDMEFKTLITGEGTFYSLTLKKNGCEITFMDSAKIFQSSIESLGKKIGIKKLKDEMDYRDYTINKTSLAYLNNDIEIMRHYMLVAHKMEHNKLTNSSFGFAMLVNYIGGAKSFKRMFPYDDGIDKVLRPCYMGGVSYVNQRHEKYKWLDEEHINGVLEVGKGCVLDINASYSGAQFENSYPYGKPTFFENVEFKHQQGTVSIIKIYVHNAVVKDDKVPFIHVKNDIRYFASKIYTSFYDVELTLTEVDFEMFIESYYVDYTTICFWRFSSIRNFEPVLSYIEHWNSEKAKYKGKDECMYAFAKNMLNAPTGKWASRGSGEKKIPFMVNNKVEYRRVEEKRKLYYLPWTAFITAYGRRNLLTVANDNFRHFCYCDTDSVHLDCEFKNTNLKNVIVHPTQLGAWDLELEFEKARYIRPKTYIEQYIKEGEMQYKCTCAGMPASIRKKMNFETFNIDESFVGKLRPTVVEGGVKLIDVPYQLKSISYNENNFEKYKTC